MVRRGSGLQRTTDRTRWRQVLPCLTAFKVHNNFIPWVLLTDEDTELVSGWQMTQRSQIRVSVASKPELCQEEP